MHIEVIHNSKSLVAESIRTLRSNLQFSEFGKNIKLIVITSANPNEGKSEVSINLAASLAVSQPAGEPIPAGVVFLLGILACRRAL